jgi:hypothetical protein
MACDQSNTQSGPLVIRYKNGDNGTRPISPCDGTNPYWLSPDLWLSGGIDAATAKVGVQNTVNVRVTNISGQAVNDVNVQAWVCDFTAGIGPSSGLASAGGATPLTGFVSQIGAGQSVALTCSPAWTPVSGDAALNGGHVCLAANCYSDTDGVSIPPGAFAMCCNSHHAQHNIAVVQVQGGMQRMIRFGVVIANPDLDRQLVTNVQLRQVSSRFALGVPERRLLIDQGLVENVDTIPQIAAVSPVGRAVRTTAVSRAFRGIARAPMTLIRPDPSLELRPIAVTRFRPVDFAVDSEEFGRGRSVQTRLSPGAKTQVTLNLQLNPRAPIGSVQTFDLAQTTADGELVGGVRIVTVVTH